MKITFIHLEKDNKIDHIECAECGASLIHAIVINGTNYGMDCGAKKLGWTSKLSVSKAKFNHMEMTRKSFIAYRNAFNAGKVTKNWVENEAYRTIETFNLSIRQNGKTFNQFVEEVYEAIA